MEGAQLTRSEELAARMDGLCLPRQIAFAGAACSRARSVFALCRGATPLATFDEALAGIWAAVSRDDLPAVAAIYRPLMDAPECNVDDTLDRDWMAFLALATFEFPSALITTRLPLQALAQCAALMRTIMGEIDLRLGWTGAPLEGRLANLESAAQEKCLAILAQDPSSPDSPVEELMSAGNDVAQAIAGAAGDLAAATGWRLWSAVP